VINGQAGEITSQVEQALTAGIAPDVILNDALIRAMADVGKLFEPGEIFVPDMLIAALAMQAGLDVLKPQLIGVDSKPAGRMVIGKGDLHDIGKNLVRMMVSGTGFEIIDLGTDVPPESFVETIRNGGVNIVGLSALLTTTMSRINDTINAIVEAGLRDREKIMVGGAPVTAEYAESIEADDYAPDASRAVSLAKTLAASECME
jgi:5-methyltetrahydrofolate--homocysteine methyltransferase